jgi:hypothetical protein
MRNKVRQVGRLNVPTKNGKGNHRQLETSNDTEIVIILQKMLPNRLVFSDGPHGYTRIDGYAGKSGMLLLKPAHR